MCETWAGWRTSVTTTLFDDMEDVDQDETIYRAETYTETYNDAVDIAPLLLRVAHTEARSHVRPES
jgi:hypothetical protein